jgi:hypothetical protein
MARAGIAEVADEQAGLIVVDDDAEGAGGLGVGHLVPEEQDAPADQGDLASRVGGEVLRTADAGVHQLPLHHSVGAWLEGVDGRRERLGREHLQAAPSVDEDIVGERLELGLVPEALELVAQVQRRLALGFRAGGPGTDVHG